MAIYNKLKLSIALLCWQELTSSVVWIEKSKSQSSKQIKTSWQHHFKLKDIENRRERFIINNVLSSKARVKYLNEQGLKRRAF